MDSTVPSAEELAVLEWDTTDRSNAESTEKLVEHEEAAHEKRQWIRLTSFCNNRCTFCLDSAAHNGTYLPRRHIRSEIIEGRNNGATRLILSGGEPTIHPNYVEFIKLGSQLGYRKVQTVTNGRMFAYPEFLNACLDAGLSEITFSVHGHNAKVHDALVGVKGAYEEEIRGLKMALADGRPIINIDVCLNRGNIKGIPQLLDNMMEIGVREFDLLHIIPFGRAFDEERDTLFYDIDEAMPALQYALKLSERPDLHIWFNRFPPPYLEGYEYLIQDPYKLKDEVRGRAEEYERLLEGGAPLSCRQPVRCEKCYLEPLCDNLDEVREHVAKDSFDVFRVHMDAQGKTDIPPQGNATFEQSWITGPTAAAVATAVADLPGQRLILELDSYAGFEEQFAEGAFAGRALSRCYVDNAKDAHALLAIEADFEIAVILTPSIASGFLTALAGEASPRLVVTNRNYERMTEASEYGVDLAKVFEELNEEIPVEDLPRCISGRAPRTQPTVLDAGMLNENGRLDIHGYANRYILDHYYTKSHRCRSCVDHDTCRGAHINYVRAHGYSMLNPIEAEAQS
jgi:MoaA/NifB/PqqE/SkfB family radical SAM enzyme